MITILPVLLGSLTLVSSLTVSVDLGDQTRVQRLFSYNCGALCPAGQAGFASIDESVIHWMSDSVTRDGYAGAEVTLRNENGRYELAIDHPDLDADYGRYVSEFLNVGEVAYLASEQILAADLWNTSSWSSLLMLGLANRNPRAVQLLHFPPDTVLTRDHDYLKAATTLRWASMMHINGVSCNASQSFQSIVDIAPIAAPADAGSTLTALIPYYTSYSQQMLQYKLLTPAGTARALVVFGGPARDWFLSTYSDDFTTFIKYNESASQDYFAPLDYVQFTLAGQTVAALGANHPSAIWYQEPQGSASALQYMFEDLVAACWELGMEGLTSSQGHDVLAQCEQKYASAPQVCELYWVTTFACTVTDAARVCAGQAATCASDNDNPLMC